DVSIDLIIGAQLIDAAAGRATGRAAHTLAHTARFLRDTDNDTAERVRTAMSDDVDALVSRHPDTEHATRYDRELEVDVDPVRAVFSAWYELFPRSAAAGPGQHGTFADVERRLDYVEELGVDVLDLPPIHPIGVLRRKGPNNREAADPDDVGSPWAIG